MLCSLMRKVNVNDKITLQMTQLFVVFRREFTLAEIEHFVDPTDKSHPKFASVSELKVMLYPAKNQMDGEPALETTLGDAINMVTMSNDNILYTY